MLCNKRSRHSGKPKHCNERELGRSNKDLPIDSFKTLLSKKKKKKIMVTQTLPEENRSVILKPTTHRPPTNTQVLSFPFQTLQKGCLLSLFSSRNKQGDPLLLTALIKGVDDLHVVQSKGQTAVLGGQSVWHGSSSPPGPLASASPLFHHRWQAQCHWLHPLPLCFHHLVAPNETCVLRTPKFTSLVWIQHSTHTQPAPPRLPLMIT